MNADKATLVRTCTKCGYNQTKLSQRRSGELPFDPEFPPDPILSASLEKNPRTKFVILKTEPNKPIPHDPAHPWAILSCYKFVIYVARTKYGKRRFSSEQEAKDAALQLAKDDIADRRRRGEEPYPLWQQAAGAVGLAGVGAFGVVWAVAAIHAIIGYAPAMAAWCVIGEVGNFITGDDTVIVPSWRRVKRQ
jgi:hypothetical protein